MNIIQKPSPNFSQRKYKPEMIVIHIMVGNMVGTAAHFKDPKSVASAHYGVGLKGEIHQYVKETDKAWHAGVVDRPSFKLYKPGVNPNDYTIGIECEGKDLSKNPLLQLETVANLIKEIASRWNIPIDREHVIGHYQINLKNRPNCPATDKSVIDKIISLTYNDEIVTETFTLSKSNMEKVKLFIKTL